MIRSFFLLLGFGCAAVCAAQLPRALTPQDPPLSAAARLGKAMFFDKHLSGSGKLSCASCHDPQFAYGPAGAEPVHRGGVGLGLLGTRAIPSLRYKQYTPLYQDLYSDPDGIGKPGPGGGLTWDGRASTLAEQARIPLLAANEMANAGPLDVATKIRRSKYAAAFRQEYGEAVFADPQLTFEAALKALAAFQTEDTSFHPYDSKFDLFRTGRANYMSAAEIRGLAAFQDPKRGNCIACHLSGKARGGAVSPFTDYAYSAIGVPRNTKLPSNGNASFYDLGLCAAGVGHSPDLTPQYCGLFKTPTLRNVALRKVYFHNGKFTSLRQVVEFYNSRDTNPEKWYPAEADGEVHPFDDLPLQYHGNIDQQSPTVHTRGAAPALSPSDVDDIVAFLSTLTDGYRPPPGAKPEAASNVAFQDPAAIER